MASTAVPPRLALALLVAALLLMPSIPVSADYGPTVVAGTSSNSQRKVAVAADGAIYVTYTEPLNNSTAVFVKRSTDRGATWTTLPRLSTAEAFRSCVAVDARGNLHVAWTEFVGPDRQVFYARWEGGPTWTGAERLSDTPGYSGFPSLAVDSQDRVHLVWYGFGGTTYQVYYRFLDASGWHATVQATRGVQDANNPAVAVGPDDKVHVAFFTYVRGDLDVWYMQGGPSRWDLVQRVNPAGVPSGDPSVAVFVNGTPVIAYSSGSNASSEVRLAERDAAGNWSLNVAVSLLGEGAGRPSIVASPRGELAVLYETAAGEIRFRIREGPVWKPPSTVATAGGARWVSAAWASFPAAPFQANVSVVWTEQAGTEYRLGFQNVRLFTPVVDGLTAGPPWWQSWLVPALVVGLASASVGALWLSSARTRGGGRG